MIDDTANPIGVSSTAQMLGRGAVCILGLSDHNVRPTLFLDNNARIDANGCSVYSNGNDKRAFRLDNKASTTAAMICSAGGIWARANSSIEPGEYVIKNGKLRVQHSAKLIGRDAGFFL
ncbi:MAG: hypothetical protein AAF638_13950, partial [Pseudomonadota bacterium]